MIRIGQLKLTLQDTLDVPEEVLKRKASRILNVPVTDISKIEIIKQSIDARKKPDLFLVYTIDVLLQGDKSNKTGVASAKENAVLKKCKDKNVSIAKEVVYQFPCSVKEEMDTERPVIIGMGPAGLFCGYLLAQHGFRPILLERGADVDERTLDVERFWEGVSELNPESNVQFGEGGAGTFSDGKLNTLVKDKDGRNKYVLRTFVEHGAPERILYDAKPHIGTDILKNVVKSMRKQIIAWGGEVRFHSKVTELIVKDNQVSGVVINQEEKLYANRIVLAIGHSARDTFQMLYDKKIPMEAKAFAVGFRVEHPQNMIDATQYGEANVGCLPAAPYKVTAQASNGRGVYSFCMCPGGFVVNASSEANRLAVNGMSYSKRDSGNANSAIIVSVTPEDFGSEHPLAGLSFQRNLEQKAYQAGQGRIPVQFFKDYEENQLLMEKELDEKIHSCTKGMHKYANLRGILPDACEEAFVEGMHQFSRMIRNYDNPYALLAGVESRTSSPVRIHRNEFLQSEISGLYPCGEGAGYAGGITSAAMDGCRIAEEIAKSIVFK